jgi:hypothetical protein
MPCPTSTIARFASRPYPEFSVPPGFLTPHGAQAEVLVGAYYRQYLLAERLLTGCSITRPGVHVRERGLPTDPRGARHHLQHERPRQLRRQRGDGSLLLHGEA